MTNGDKIIDTLVDNAAGIVKRAAKKVVNGLFVDKEHSKPYMEDNAPYEFVSSKQEADFSVTDFDGGWAPMDNWHELTDHHIDGFVSWDNVIVHDEEDQLLTVSTDSSIYTFHINGSETRLIMLEQFCNELDITYDEYREIINNAELIPVLVPHGEFQKLLFNRKAEKNAALLEPHYLITLSALTRTVLKTKFTSKSAIDFKIAISAFVNRVINACCSSSIED